MALDGNDVIRQKCDSVVISPGESVDIQLQTRRSPNNYYINFKTLPTQTQSVSRIKKFVGVDSFNAVLGLRNRQRFFKF